MAHDFQKSLKVGQRGERDFIAMTDERYTQLGGRYHDLYDNSLGELVELKTDSYDMKKTPNFFFERWSDIDKRKPGGAHQALEKGASRFIYYYINNGVAFMFNTIKLVKAIDVISKSMSLMRVPNKGWVTAGYLIPRDKLSRLYEEVKLRRSK